MIIGGSGRHVVYVLRLGKEPNQPSNNMTAQRKNRKPQKHFQRSPFVELVFASNEIRCLLRVHTGSRNNELRSLNKRCTSLGTSKVTREFSRGCKFTRNSMSLFVGRDYFFFLEPVLSSVYQGTVVGNVSACTTPSPPRLCGCCTIRAVASSCCTSCCDLLGRRAATVSVFFSKLTLYVPTYTVNWSRNHLWFE